MICHFTALFALLVATPPSGSQITIADLELLPGGTFSDGLAINNQSIIVGLANDSTFALQRPLWNANTGALVSFADNMNPASTAIPEHINDAGEMAGTEMYGDNVYQGVYWNPTGQAFALPPMAGVDPFYGALTKAHGINNLDQIVGTGKEGAPNFYRHAVLWPDKDTDALDLGFLGQGIPLNYSQPPSVIPGMSWAMPDPRTSMLTQPSGVTASQSTSASGRAAITASPVGSIISAKSSAPAPLPGTIWTMR